MLNFVHIGIGQCGNRFAEQFGKNGRLAFAINTARVDMSSIDNKVIAPKNQIHIALPGNKDGAGRNPEVGKESMEANLDRVFETIVKSTKDIPVDRFVLWAGLGGGTGTGGVIPLMQFLVSKGLKVMLGLTIPRKQESWVVRMNAVKALTNILNAMNEDRRNIVPYILIDNDRVEGDIASENERIVRDLVRFTKTTTNAPASSAFDDTDFARLLNYRGLISVVRTAIPTEALGGTESLLKEVNEARSKLLLIKGCPEDALGEANLVIVPSKFLKVKGNLGLINENISYAESFSPQANTYSCIYEAKNDDIDKIIVYTLLTGMPNPDEDIDEIYDDISEQINETKERRKELNRNSLRNQARRRSLDFDPNDINFDDDIV